MVSTDELLRRIAAAGLPDVPNLSLPARALWNVIIRRRSDAGPLQRHFDHMVFEDHQSGEHRVAANSMCADCLHAAALEAGLM